MRLVLRLLTVLIVTAGASAALAAAAAAAPARPFVDGDHTVPAYSYSDAIHESVYVTAPIDSDNDGSRDRIAVDIVRPAEAAQAGVPVPVIMEASPYYACCGRGNESELKTYYADGTIAKMPLYYDNYFVPRGYAMVGVDLTGTSRSGGCGDVGGRDEVLGAKAVIDWLNGRTSAYDAAGKKVSASWANGKVGMIGKSWDGSIANGVAATGVDGLKTIVPISSISSWYDYTRFNGVLRSPGYVDFLANYVGAHPAACQSVIAAEQQASDDSTGNLNYFWQQRNYRQTVSKVKASVFVVHGLNDQNVTTNQFGTWWNLLAANNVTRKIWLSQDGHVDPFDYRRAAWVHTLHEWFDHELQGLPNDILSQPQADVQRPDGHWITQSQWPSAGTTATATPLSGLGGAAYRSFTDDPNLTEDEAVAAPTSAKAGRLVFESGALTKALAVSGSPSVTLRVKVDRPTTELSARLVDYGPQRRVDYESAGEGISTLKTQSCWGESTETDDGCYYDTAQDYVTSGTDIVTRGWLDAAHHVTLTKQTPLTPGQWYTITVPIDTTDDVIAAGHRVALVLTQSDEEYTTPAPTGATVTVDPTHSTLNLPVTGSTSIPAGATLSTVAVAPKTVSTPAVTTPKRVP